MDHISFKPAVFASILLMVVLLVFSTWLVLAGPLTPPPPIVLDGICDDIAYTLLAQDLTDLSNPGPGEFAGTQWAEFTALYAADDGTYFYVCAPLPNYRQTESTGEIGLAIDTTGDVPDSGGTADPWQNPIAFAYNSVNNNVGQTPTSTNNLIYPDVIIRGNLPTLASAPPSHDPNNGWTELRAWNGSQWTGASVNWGGIPQGSQVGSRIAYAHTQGVELSIPWADLGVTPGSQLNLEFYATQKQSPAGGSPWIKGAYDTVPDDDQIVGWDDATTQQNLASYPPGPPPPTATPGPSPTPTSTPEPTNTPPPGVCNTAAPGDGNIATDHVYHNSLWLAYREPLGSISITGTAKLRLRTCHDDVQQVKLWVWKTGDPLNSPSNKYTAVITATDPSGPYDIWEYPVPAPGTVIDQWYQFEVTDGSATGYYHVLAGGGNAGPGEWSATLLDRSWKLGTLAAPPQDYTVPSWMKDAVIYQIFPDRFRNGDTSNDPPAYSAGTQIYGPNTCNGYPHGRGSGPQCVVDLRESWTTPLLIPSWGLDFYGGDLKGVIDKINQGYFNDLGVNTLYFNPVFSASSNHGYDTNDYYTIRAYFGGNAKFDELITAANAHGLRVILDGVFNHAGSDSKYIDGYGRNRWPSDTGACESSASPYRSWFKQGGTGTEYGCADNWKWGGWYGYETIPELVEIDPVKAFFYRGGSPQSPGGASVTEYWIDKGIAGWRFDVAQDITHDWWQDMRPYVKSTYGSNEILMLGEVTGGCDWNLYKSYLNQNELDSVMNYCFRDWSVGFANGGNPSNFDSSYNSFRALFPRSPFYAMMNLISSHDSPRALNLLGGDTARLKLIALLQMTLPGAPSVYYGDEVALPGGGDPDNRRTYPWADQGGAPDVGVYNHYKQVIGLRNTHSALRGGELQTLLADDANHIYSYLRWNTQETIVVALNNQPGTRTAAIPLADYLDNGTVLVDILNGNDSYTVSGGMLNVPVDGQWGAILVVVGAPPTTPHNPNPANGAANVPINPILTWQGGDPTGRPVTYTLAFGNATPPPLVTTTLTVESFDPGVLLTQTTYYWIITSTNGLFETTGPLWSFGTGDVAAANRAPHQPNTPDPANGALAVSLDKILGWQGGDPDGDTITYTLAFGNVNPPPAVAATLQTQYTPTLDANTTYYWTITATDGLSETVGPLWSFVTLSPNQAPNVPSNPTPIDGSSDVPINQALSWSGGDPDGDPVTYTVAISAGMWVVAETSLTSYAPNLITGTTYSWIITATDGMSTSLGPMWTFTTALTLPPNSAPQVSTPNPADGLTVTVKQLQSLSWTGSDADGDPLTYTVAFGAANPPPIVASGLSEAQYAPGTLAKGITYYWAITVTDGISITTGPLWRFATAPNVAPNIPYNPNPPDNALAVPINQVLSWWGGDSEGDPVSYAVAFGASNPPPLVTTTQLMSYTPILTINSAYYWSITATDGISISVGPVWQFVTTGPVQHKVYLPLVLKP